MTMAAEEPPRITLADITIDCQNAELVATFWSGLFGVPAREPMVGWRCIGPLTAGGPVINFQPVPEPKVGKVRVHLDLRTDDLAGAVDLVCRLGGRRLDERHEYDAGAVQVMTDPEGNEFCLVYLWPAQGMRPG